MNTAPFPRNGRTRRMCAVWDYLADYGPSTAAEMAAAMGVSQPTTRRAVSAIRRLHPGIVRVCDWRRHSYDITGRAGGGGMAAVYEISPLADARKPRPITRKATHRATYARNRADVLTRATARRRHAGSQAIKPVWLRGLL